MKKKFVVIVVSCMLVLGACSPFKSDQPPMTVYAVHAAPSAAAEKPARVVSVAEPSVPQGFESNRLAVYLQDGRRMDYAAGAGWPGPLPKVLQDFMVQSGSAAPGIMAVTPDSGIPAGYSLLVKVNDFEPVYGADAKSAPQLKLSFTFTLLSGDKIVSSFTLAEAKTASANSLTVIVGEMESMLQEIAAQAFQNITNALSVSRKSHLTRKNPD